MIKDIIRYIIIILIVLAIVLVMRNLITKDKDSFESGSKNKDKTEEVYYKANINLLDKETRENIKGAELIIKDSEGKEIDSWTTTEGTHTINKIKTGTYTLEEKSSPENYKLNEDKVTFKVEKSNVDVAMYNEKMTEEEIQKEKELNTTSNEVNVDNTLSSKNKIVTILSILTFISGLFILSYRSTRKISYFN